MKSKELKDIRAKGISELRVEAQKLKEDIARELMHSAVSVPKDTNAAAKMKEKLAVILTIIREKELLEKAQKQ